jgi:hypothetical protein
MLGCLVAIIIPSVKLTCVEVAEGSRRRIQKPKGLTATATFRQYPGPPHAVIVPAKSGAR